MDEDPLLASLAFPDSLDFENLQPYFEPSPPFSDVYDIPATFHNQDLQITNSSDYSGLVADNELNLLSANSSGSSSALDSSSAENGSSVVQELQPRRHVRSHRKTRQGCFDCKRRRVKCQETRPACENCVRNGLRCTYPLRNVPYQLPKTPAVPQVQSMKELYSGKLEYTALDMRLMQNFISKAHPHLPVGFDEVWTHVVPEMAHEYSFLMHSILAMSATYLQIEGKIQAVPAIAYHKTKAIKGVATILDKKKTDRSIADNDALTSAYITLAFQTAAIQEGFLSYLITIRNCIAVLQAMKSLSQKSQFSTGNASTDSTNTLEFIKERMAGLPLLNQDVVVKTLIALEELEGECGSDLECTIFRLLQQTVCQCRFSSLQAYLNLTSLYTYMITIPEKDFSRITSFVNPNSGSTSNSDFDSDSTSTSPILAILITYFVTLQAILKPLLKQEWSSPEPGSGSDSTTSTSPPPPLCENRPKIKKVTKEDYLAIQRDLNLVIQNAEAVIRQSGVKRMGRYLVWPREILGIMGMMGLGREGGGEEGMDGFGDFWGWDGV